MQTGNQQQQPEQQNHEPQKCPRCESPNTKFCYYNNYSLSQPRYFCKTCRRYWTQGGTLRNIPVGGGCRKDKRSRTPSSSSARSPQPQPQPQPPHDVEDQDIQKNLMTISSVGMSTTSPTSSLVSHHQYYPGSTHGYLSSYAAIQSLNQSQPFNAGGLHDPSSNLSLQQGFNLSASFGASQQQQQQPYQFFQMGSTKSNMVDQQPLYPSDQESLLIQSSTGTQASDHDWPLHQSFMNKSASNTSAAASESALWAMGSSNPSSTSGNINMTDTASAGPPSMSPSQWPDLPRSYGSTP